MSAVMESGNAAERQDELFARLILAEKAGDAADGIECAVGTINDLLRLALDDLSGVLDTRAGSAIRGAKRFIGDIGAIATRLHEASRESKRGTQPGTRHGGWTAAVSGLMPDSDRDVLAWETAEQLPVALFFSAEENCWLEKHNGRRLELDAVTHWQEIQTPEGVPV